MSGWSDFARELRRSIDLSHRSAEKAEEEALQFPRAHDEVERLLERAEVFRQIGYQQERRLYFELSTWHPSAPADEKGRAR